VLKCVAMCCSLEECGGGDVRLATFAPVLQCVVVCCSVLQCVAVFGSGLPCVAVCYSVLQSRRMRWKWRQTSHTCTCV